MNGKTGSSFFILSLLLTLGRGALLGQNSRESEQDQKQLLTHEITVTAERIETNLKETAGSVTVLTRKDLLSKHKTTVLEALEDLPGMHLIQNGPVGSSASIHLRGANSEHTKVLLDGIELNDPMTPSRSSNPAHILIQNIERIEIIRGPQSTLYGSDALGGVINIITRRRQGPPQINLSAQAGSYATVTAGTEIAGGSEKLKYTLGAAWLRSAGFSAAGTEYAGNQEKDGYSNWTLSGKLESELRSNLDFVFSLRAFRAETEIDNLGGDYGDDPNNRETNQNLFLNSGINGRFYGGRWESRLNLGFIRNDRRYDNPTDDIHPEESDHSRYLSRIAVVDWQNNLYLHESHIVTAGLEWKQEQGESEYYSQGPWGPEENLFPQKSSGNLGIFLQDRIRAGGRFFATLGIRIDAHSRAGDALTFRAAPAYLIESTGTKVKATLGTGFKAPSLYQLFAPETAWGPVGNQHLEAERNTGWDLGVEQDFFHGRVQAGATLFSNRFKNLIDFDFVRGYINIGRASTQGIEAFLRISPSEYIRLFSTYTRTDAEDSESGEPLMRRPKDKFTAQISSSVTENIDLALSLIHIGKRFDTAYVGWSATQVVLDAYTLIHASASYQILPQIQAFIRLENLLNRRYEIIKGYGTPGFSVYTGLRWNH